ncbi:MAG: DUF429 domain-containing protein [Gemmatimonas sp.]
MTRVLSVDLAYKRHRDIGVVLLDATETGIEATIVDALLADPPHAHTLADWLHALAERHHVAGIAIDGPLGWKAPGTDAPHCRMSEKAVRAPGKTGLPPDGVKPRGYLAFTEFSIALFERFTTRYGYALPGSGHAVPEKQGATGDRGARFVTETFPTAAWRSLGLTPVPGKGRTTPDALREAVARLTARVPLQLDRAPTHDQLQAVVGGLAPLAWSRGHTQRVTLAGEPPHRLDGCWREGYIMIPSTLY